MRAFPIPTGLFRMSPLFLVRKTPCPAGAAQDMRRPSTCRDVREPASRNRPGISRQH